MFREKEKGDVNIAFVLLYFIDSGLLARFRLVGFEANFCVLFGFHEQLLGNRRVGFGKRLIARLAHDEVAVGARRVFAVERERIFEIGRAHV